MYIAVIADNIAERKQTERMLGRANLALSGELGTLYIDSYGDEDAFMHACMKYEWFIIDFDHDYKHSLAVADKLKESAAPGLIAICKYEEDPFLHEFAEHNVYTLEKPLRTEPLHQMIREIHTVIEKQKASRTILEIRGKSETRYIDKNEIVYARYDEKTHIVDYHFHTQPPFSFVGTPEDICKLLGDFDEFRVMMKNTMVNTNYIVSDTKKGIRLLGGETLEYPSLLTRIFFSH